MKKLILIFSVIAVLPSVFAQTITAELIPNSNSSRLAYDYPKYDNGDNLCALVIFKMQYLNNIKVKGGFVFDTISHGDSLFVYVADHAKNITIYHSDFETAVLNLPDYINDAYGARSGRTYLFELRGSTAIRHERSKESNYVYVKSDVPLSGFTFDGKSWSANGKRSLNKLVSCGEYHYHATAEGYNDINGTVDVTKSLEPVSIILKFRDDI